MGRDELPGRRRRVVLDRAAGIAGRGRGPTPSALRRHRRPGQHDHPPRRRHGRHRRAGHRIHRPRRQRTAVTDTTVDIEPRPVEFATRQGLTLRGDGWGDPTHRPVFLAHGGGQTRHSWGGTADAVAQRGWYAVAYDQRGHGDSDWSEPGAYDIVRYGEDLADIIAGSTQRPVVVGASLGGLAGLLVEGDLAPGSCAA